MERKHQKVIDETDELMPAAFSVDGTITEEELKIAPTTGLDYLKRVRKEAEKCPGIVTSDINARNFDSFQSEDYIPLPPRINQTPTYLIPNEEWKNTLLKDFEKFQQNLSLLYRTKHKAPKGLLDIKELHLPPFKNTSNWKQVIFGVKEKTTKKEDSENISNESINEDVDTTISETTQQSNCIKPPTHKPTLKLILNMDDVTIYSLVMNVIKWITNETENRISNGDQSDLIEIISEERSEWLYSLLARLEKPLDPDMSASLRDLLRSLYHIRNTTQIGDYESLSRLQIIITLIEYYFGQRELN